MTLKWAYTWEGSLCTLSCICSPWTKTNKHSYVFPQQICLLIFVQSLSQGPFCFKNGICPDLSFLHKYFLKVWFFFLPSQWNQNSALPKLLEILLGLQQPLLIIFCHFIFSSPCYFISSSNIYVCFSLENCNRIFLYVYHDS